MRDKAPITIPDHSRKQAIASIRRSFTNHTEEEIGELKAALLFDYFLTEVGPSIYNQALADARSFFEERAADLGGVCYQAEFPFWAKPRASTAGTSSRDASA